MKSVVYHHHYVLSTVRTSPQSDGSDRFRLLLLLSSSSSTFDRVFSDGVSSLGRGDDTVQDGWGGDTQQWTVGCQSNIGEGG